MADVRRPKGVLPGVVDSSDRTVDVIITTLGEIRPGIRIKLRDDDYIRLGELTLQAQEGSKPAATNEPIVAIDPVLRRISTITVGDTSVLRDNVQTVSEYLNLLKTFPSRFSLLVYILGQTEEKSILKRLIEGKLLQVLAQVLKGSNPEVQRPRARIMLWNTLSKMPVTYLDVKTSGIGLFVAKDRKTKKEEALSQSALKLIRVWSRLPKEPIMTQKAGVHSAPRPTEPPVPTKQVQVPPNVVMVPRDEGVSTKRVREDSVIEQIGTESPRKRRLGPGELKARLEEKKRQLRLAREQSKTIMIDADGSLVGKPSKAFVANRVVVPEERKEETEKPEGRRDAGPASTKTASIEKSETLSPPGIQDRDLLKKDASARKTDAQKLAAALLNVKTKRESRTQKPDVQVAPQSPKVVKENVAVEPKAPVERKVESKPREKAPTKKGQSRSVPSSPAKVKKEVRAPQSEKAMRIRWSTPLETIHEFDSDQKPRTQLPTYMQVNPKTLEAFRDRLAQAIIPWEDTIPLAVTAGPRGTMSVELKETQNRLAGLIPPDKYGIPAPPRPEDPVDDKLTPKIKRDPNEPDEAAPLPVSEDQMSSLLQAISGLEEHNVKSAGGEMPKSGAAGTSPEVAKLFDQIGMDLKIGEQDDFKNALREEGLRNAQPREVRGEIAPGPPVNPGANFGPPPQGPPLQGPPPQEGRPASERLSGFSRGFPEPSYERDRYADTRERGAPMDRNVGGLRPASILPPPPARREPDRKPRRGPGTIPSRCRFFNTPSGCRNGMECPFQHIKE